MEDGAASAGEKTTAGGGGRTAVVDAMWFGDRPGEAEAGFSASG
jgi:hypothetical protein